MQLRDYQQECIDIIEQKPPGAYLVQMATGLGKTKTFTHLPRHGRVLILSHREELVKQPLKDVIHVVKIFKLTAKLALKWPRSTPIQMQRLLVHLLCLWQNA